MAGGPGWYPPGQTFYPPELPASFKNVYDLKPIVGVPKDDEMMGIHAIIHAANRVSGVPGMHDTNLYMKLSDHLFNAQMAKYRSKYSLITFPADATYTPPALPAHMPVTLDSVAGSPSDEEIIKVQDALRSYQELRTFPSMFDAHVNMELSQHLFDIQMARHMRLAGENQPTPAPQATEGHRTPPGMAEQAPNATEEAIPSTNNAGTGENATETPQTPQPVPAFDIHELLERSNQLAERFNQLLELSNEIAERFRRPSDQPNSLAERFNQVLERFSQLVERTHQPNEHSDRLAERFNQLLERLNHLIEQSNQPAQRANELADRSNQLAEKLNQSSERSNQLAEQAIKPVEKLGDLMKNINRILMGIQHAIVRTQKGNTLYAIDCLVNEKGLTPKEVLNATFGWKLDNTPRDAQHQLPIRIGGVIQGSRLYDYWVGHYLRFYGIGEGLREGAASEILKEGKGQEARQLLADYLSSCLG